MEEKKEIRIKFSTLIIIILILIIIGLVTNIIYNPRTKEVTNNNEVIENKITENKVETTTQEAKKDKEITTIKGEKLVQFDSNFFGLKDVAQDYRLSENIKNYKDFNYDLDGDGVTDKITIQKNKENDGESYLFKLNGKGFAEHYSRPEIYIVDLNEKDNNIEVVIFDEGPSDDPGYIIYSKEGNKMLETLRVDGYSLKTDKKGIVVFVNSHNRRLNGYTNPEIYFDYYFINNTKIEKKYIDIDKIKHIDFSTSLYFTENYNNKDIFWDNFDGVDYKKRFKELNIEELDESITFNILKFEIVRYEEDDEEDEDYKIYVRLSDGRKGYIFDIQLAG